MGKQIPIKHISARVPWHDNGWDGTVCKAPKDNASCLFLARIAMEKDDVYEETIAGKILSQCSKDKYPPCVAEKVNFMAEHELIRVISHPYSETNELYKHFKPTHFRIPPFSYGAIPFRWMMKDGITHESKVAKELGIEYNVEFEPKLGFNPIWVQDARNQVNLLETFSSAIEPEKSLVFFYAKHVPFYDKGDRVLIGVGKVKSKSSIKEHEYFQDGPTRSVIWDINMQHSIRPDFKDGLILPYHDLIVQLKNNPELDVETLIAVAPNRDEFSYGAEHVSHDTAIDSLLRIGNSLRKLSYLLLKNYDKQLKWIDDRISELWSMRGPYPGLGAVLKAFGITEGNMLAWEIFKKIEEEQKELLSIDPWRIVERMFQKPESVLPDYFAKKIGKVLQNSWKVLSSERKNYLKLLSRMELTNDQAGRFYDESQRIKYSVKCSDEDLLENPYLFYEFDRFSPNHIALNVVDKGMFPADIIRDKFPLPEPSLVEEDVDWRRVRAISVSILEEASWQGHSLLPASTVITKIRDAGLQPSCPVTQDIMNVVESSFNGSIKVDIAFGGKTYQLERLSRMKDIISNFVSKRIEGKRHDIEADWAKLLNDKLDKLQGFDIEDTEEIKARKEKVAALEELSKSRFAILVGSAGTGKTTLLSVLCNQKDIANGGVLLLAPTGKARVRMEQTIGFKSQTIAQFLLPTGRYNDETGIYCLSAREKNGDAKTVIVDEASMLTEEQLGALIDGIKGVERFILVGDHRQLPPIGTGRPFVDIVTFLRPEDVEAIFPRVGKGYTELIVARRQKQSVDKPELLDVELANWYSGAPLSPVADDIIGDLLRNKNMQRLRLVEWQNANDLIEKMMSVLVEELNLTGLDDNINFEKSLGGKVVNEYIYFDIKASEKIENWQILSPVKGYGYGVREINRLIQRTFRKKTLQLAFDFKKKKIPQPMGPESIVYGDKVINIINHKRRKVYSENPAIEPLRYIANGEIGIITGVFRGNYKKWSGELPLNISFSSQPGYSYVYRKGDFREEADIPIELAYAITVHKAQGSDFKLVFLILPNPCQLLSRELLYTALTRQKEKLVIFHQGNFWDLKKYSYGEFSETSRRVTNLFYPPKLTEIKHVLYEERLIHKTTRGEFVRSKSEVIIADCLLANQVEYMYEKKLIGKDGSERYPDFTIMDEDSGDVYYWEHLGMLMDEEYSYKWKSKLNWYKDQGIAPFEEGGGKEGTLIVSKDAADGSIDAQEIDKKIKQIILKNY